MKKRWIGIVLACCVCLAGTGLTACGGEQAVTVPYDDMIHEDGSYDENIFTATIAKFLRPTVRY